MNRILIVINILFVLWINSLYSQTNNDTKPVIKIHRFSISAGMGLSIQNNSSFTNFLRQEIPYATSDSIKSFNTGIEFFGGIEYSVSKKFAVKLDYSYFIRSVSYIYTYNNFNYNINIHQPYLFGFYLIHKKSFDLKFGLGAGYHFGTVEQQLNQNSSVIYKSGGVSIRGEAMFAPYLSKNLQANLSGFIVGSFFNPLKDSNGNYLYSTNSTMQVNLGGFGVGARIGFAFIIN